jgi:hypothetical protein
MRRHAVWMMVAALSVPLPVAAAPKPNLLTCTGFMREFPQALPSFKVSFERPLTITKDLFGADEPGIDIHVLSTNADVDGTLRCRGDEFRRFEVRIAAPAEAATETNFSQFEQAALATTLHLDKGKIAAVIGAMSADADEYLKASIQRGDTYNAGKVEYHQGTTYDLGMIWTPSDKSLIVTTQDDD